MNLLLGTLLTLVAPQTDAEAEAFARALVADVRKGDAAAVDARCDVAAALDAATKGLDASDPLVRNFRRGFAPKSGFGFGPVLKGIVDKGGSYALLRVRRVGGRPRALFRLLHNDGSLNYHDAELAGSPPRIVDVHILLAGESVSELYRRMLMSALAAQPGIVARMLGEKNEYGRALPALGAFSKLLREEKYAELWAAYDGLPAILKKDKHVLYLRCLAGPQIGPAESLRAFEDYRAAFPDDPCLELICVDPLIAAMKYPEALEAVDRLERRLGGDPYLHVLRANIHTLREDPAQAVKHCRQAIAAEKTLAPAYEALLGLLLHAKEFKATAETLDAYERDAGVELNDLSTIEGYGDFLKSDAGRAWQASRGKK